MEPLIFFSGSEPCLFVTMYFLDYLPVPVCLPACLRTLPVPGLNQLISITQSYSDLHLIPVLSRDRLSFRGTLNDMQKRHQHTHSGCVKNILFTPHSHIR